MECTICKKTFTRQDILKKHIAKHNEKKKHRCEKCGKDFKRKDDKTCHERICRGQDYSNAVQPRRTKEIRVCQ